MTMRRIDDGDPFNVGWNACLDEVAEQVKKMPTEGAIGPLALIIKADVLDILRDGDGASLKEDGQ